MKPRYSSEAPTPLQTELLETMQGWGCPLCRLANKAERAYIESLNYERVLDLKTRDALKASRGLCHRHSLVWRDVQGSALGIAIVYRVSILDLLRDTAGSDEAQSAGLFRRREPAVSIAGALEPSSECPACRIGHETARRFSALLLEGMVDATFRSQLAACGGLCLPHLRDTLRMPGASQVSVRLLRCHRQIWERLMGELEEFIRKNDYRFSDERLTPQESTSWTRALSLLTGYDKDDSTA